MKKHQHNYTINSKESLNGGLVCFKKTHKGSTGVIDWLDDHFYISDIKFDYLEGGKVVIISFPAVPEEYARKLASMKTLRFGVFRDGLHHTASGYIYGSLVNSNYWLALLNHPSAQKNQFISYQELVQGYIVRDVGYIYNMNGGNKSKAFNKIDRTDWFVQVNFGIIQIDHQSDPQTTGGFQTVWVYDDEPYQIPRKWFNY